MFVDAFLWNASTYTCCVSIHCHFIVNCLDNRYLQSTRNNTARPASESTFKVIFFQNLISSRIQIGDSVAKRPASQDWVSFQIWWVAYLLLRTSCLMSSILTLKSSSILTYLIYSNFPQRGICSLQKYCAINESCSIKRIFKSIDVTTSKLRGTLMLYTPANIFLLTWQSAAASLLSPGAARPLLDLDGAAAAAVRPGAGDDGAEEGGAGRHAAGARSLSRDRGRPPTNCHMYSAVRSL